MQPKTSSVSSSLIGGIAAAITALLSLKEVVDFSRYRLMYGPDVFPITGIVWGILLLAAYAFLAAMLLMKKQSVLLSIGFGVIALNELRNLFSPYTSFSFRLIYLLRYAAFIMMALLLVALLTQALPTLRETAKKFWFVPAACLAVCIVFRFLALVWGLFFVGSGFGFFIQQLFSNTIAYALIAVVLLCTAAWTIDPNGGLFPGVQPRSAAPAISAASSTASSAADSCGTAPAGGYASAASGGYTAQNTVPAGSAYCSMVKHVLLLLFTFGIWYYIWIYRTTRYLNQVEDEPPRNPTTKLLLCMFVPFYAIYWIYKSAQRLDKLSISRGIPSDLSTLCLILAIFVGIIPPILMQDKINALETGAGDAQPYAAPQYAAPQYSAPQYTAPRQRTPGFDVADELKKYKDLLDCGAITQEEFDAKKKQLLDL